MPQKVKTNPPVRKRRRIGRAKMPDVQLRSVVDLKPYATNARLHSPQQIGQIKSSIEKFGFITPIIVNSEDSVIAGHGRLEAAKEIGLPHVPVLKIEHLSGAQEKAYRLADNKIAENATWDEDLLRIEIKELIELELDGELEIDMQTIGFETAEIDLLFAEAFEEQAPEVIETARDIAVAQIGDFWGLGRHRLACGSALDEGVLHELMQAEHAKLVLTDPPYNVPVNGHVRVKGDAGHREFAMATGEMTETEFTSFLETALSMSVAHTYLGAIVMIFMDWRHLTELEAASNAAGLEQINLCVWVKSNGGMGSLYRSQHELCMICKLPGAKHQNNVRLGSMGRNRTNVWAYAGVNTFGRNRKADLVDHPTVKPAAMIEDAIRDVTRHGDIVLDPFGGSGTTLIAAERCHRTARLIELDPGYVDVTIRRWQELTGEAAIELSSGESWHEREARLAAVAYEEAQND